MKLNKLLLFTIITLAVDIACRAQVRTPPVSNLNTSININIGNNVVNIFTTSTGFDGESLSEWNVSGITSYSIHSTITIVGLCPKPGIGNMDKFYALLSDGSVREYLATYFGGHLSFSELTNVGKWNLNTTSPGFTEIRGDALYVLNNGIVGKSPDNGVTWAYDTAGAPYIRNFDMDTGQNLYATDGSGKVFYQSASGTSWTAIAAFPSGMSPQALYVDRRNYVYVGTNGNGVYHSTDAGATWIPGNTGLTSVQCGRMCDDAFGNLYLIGNSGTKLYRSADVGVTWVRIDTPITRLFAAASGFTSYINDIKGDTVLKAVTAAGQFFSTDQGTTWTQYNKGLAEVSLNGFYKTAAGRLVETSNNGVFYLDAGDSIWQRPLPVDGYASAGKIYSDTLGNIYVNQLTALSEAPIMKSTDGGVTWQSDTLGYYLLHHSIGGYAVDEAGNEHIADNYSQGSAVAFTKTPGGAFVYDTLGIGVPSSAYDNINAFGSDGNGYVYLSGSFSHTPNVWRRPSAGGTWVVDSLGTGGGTFLVMISDKSHTMIGSPLYRHAGLSYRHSGIWTKMTYPTGIPANANVSALAADNSNGVLAAFSAYDFAGNRTIGLGIYCTHDYGATWAHVGLDSFYVSQLVNEGDSTYAITSNVGIYALTCAGVVGDPALGIAEANSPATDGMTLYPNPANGTCHIRLSSTNASADIVIYDLMGKTVIMMPVQTGSGEISFDTRDMAGGLYFCAVRAGGETMIKKLVVEK